MIIGSNLSPSNAAAGLQAGLLQAASTAQPDSSAGLLSTGDATSDTSAVSLLNTQLSSLDTAQQDIGAALSFTQTQEAYLQNISDALNQMSRAAELAADPSATDAQRAGYQAEYSQLSNSITAMSSSDFNGVSLFSATPLEVASGSGTGSLTLPGASLGGSGYSDALDASVGTAAEAQDALSKVGNALAELSQQRAGVNSNLSRLNSAADQLSVGKENLNAAVSAIQDADAAEEVLKNTLQSILSQSGNAMLAQANAMPQNALRLSS